MQVLDDLVLRLIYAASQWQTDRDCKLDLLTEAVARLAAEHSRSETTHDILDRAHSFLTVLLEPDAIEDRSFEVLLVTAADLLLQVKALTYERAASDMQLSLRYGYFRRTRSFAAANSGPSRHGAK